MAKPIKIKESDLTNMVKRILAEKGVDENIKDCQCGALCPSQTHCHYGCCGGKCCDADQRPDGVEKTHAGSDYEGIDHKDRSKFDGRKSKVIGVDSDIEDQRFEKNMKEGYRKYGCKFLQSRKSLNEDKLTNLFETDRDIREQNILSKKLRFIESAIKHTKCGTILREQKETTPNNRNDYRRTRKLIYENMDWEAVRRNNNRRLRN
tara:strand:+ start:7853 stop:8470 length:618 start_codon:yes stop_codon:yes gene_type:complete